VAFGIPGVLMFIATLMFWLGRKQYVMCRRPAVRIRIRFQRGAHRADRAASGRGAAPACGSAVAVAM
jgi:POT family proton-dependent oligopeptide transporter